MTTIRRMQDAVRCYQNVWSQKIDWGPASWVLKATGLRSFLHHSNILISEIVQGYRDVCRLSISSATAILRINLRNFSFVTKVARCCSQKVWFVDAQRQGWKCSSTLWFALGGLFKAGHVPIGTANYSSQWPVPGMLRLACVVWRLGVEQAASDWPGACSRSSAHARRSVCDKPTSEVSGWLCLLSFYASFFLSFTSVSPPFFFAFLLLPDFLHFGCRNHEGNIFMSYGSRSVCLRSLFSRLLCLAQDLQIAFGLGCFCHAPRENHRWAVEPLM